MDETRVSPGSDVGWDTGSTDEVIARRNWSGRDALAVTAVTVTVQLHGVDVIDLPSLSEAIDSDAPCQLFILLTWVATTGGGTRGSIASAHDRIGFRYTVCDVTARADGTVIVTPVRRIDT